MAQNSPLTAHADAQFPIAPLALIGTGICEHRAWHCLDGDTDIDTENAGAVGHHFAGNALIALVYLMGSKGRVFAFAPLPLVNEPRPVWPLTT